MKKINSTKTFSSRSSLAIRTCALMTASSLFLGACVSSNVRQQHGTVKGDRCTDQREVLLQVEDRFNESIWKAALIGAATGAVISAIKGGGNLNFKSLLKGAAIGALTGAAAGYFQAQFNRSKDRAGLLAAINSDAGKDAAAVSSVGAAYKSLAACRVMSYKQILAEFKKGKIDKKVALQRKHAIDALVARDKKLVAALLDKAGERNDKYLLAAGTASSYTQDKFNLLKQASKLVAASSQPASPASALGGLLSGLSSFGQVKAPTTASTSVPTATAKPVQASVVKPPKVVVPSVDYVASKSESLYADASISGKVLTKVAQGQVVELMDPKAQGQWASVKYQGKTGFMPRKALVVADSKEAEQAMQRQKAANLAKFKREPNKDTDVVKTQGGIITKEKLSISGIDLSLAALEAGMEADIAAVNDGTKQRLDKTKPEPQPTQGASINRSGVLPTRIS